MGNNDKDRSQKEEKLDVKAQIANKIELLDMV